MTAAFRVESLSPDHDRGGFSCGIPALDAYLARQATQDIRRRVSACYVLIEVSSGKIVGYYTLAAASVALADLPEAVAKKLPRYPSVPAARVGRLAIADEFHGKKLGGALLADAADRAARSEVAIFALLVDAKDDIAANFYLHLGFEPLGAKSRQLFVPLARFRDAAV